MRIAGDATRISARFGNGMATKKKTARKATSKKTVRGATAAPKGPPKTIDELIARAAPEQRPALETLRKQIHSVVPGAVECISYGQAGFRVGGKAVVWFGAAKKHVSLFPGAVVAAGPSPWAFHFWCGNPSMWTPNDLTSLESLDRFLAEHRPDYVGLLCLRNDHDNVAGLRTASIRRALPLLPEKTRAILREPRFVTHAPASFGDGLPPASPRPLLEGDPADPDIQVDFACTEPQGAEAEAAMAELSRALDEVALTFVLEPGDLAVLDNRLALHGRTSFRPRYDGADRWLQRSFMHLDARRTRPVREADGNVLS